MKINDERKYYSHLFVLDSDKSNAAFGKNLCWK